MTEKDSWISRLLSYFKKEDVSHGRHGEERNHENHDMRGDTHLRTATSDQEGDVDISPQPEYYGDEVKEWKRNKMLLDQYVVEGVLGKGGMGTVYLVVRRDTDGQRYAVKTLLSSALEDEKMKGLFMRELRTWSEFPEHPNMAACRFSEP